MKNTLIRTKKNKINVSGYRKRLKTKNGKKILKLRRKKGRKILTKK